MKFTRMTDLLLVGTLLLISLLSWGVYTFFPPDEFPQAEVYYQNELVDTLPLTGIMPSTYKVYQVPQVILVLDGQGGIRFGESDCPDQICVHSGVLSKPGQFAACLPNGVVVKIIPGKQDHEAPELILGNMKGIE